MKTKSPRYWQLAPVLFALFLAATESSFAAFPPFLVIDGTAYPGYADSEIDDQFDYSVSSGTLTLSGCTGGAAVLGSATGSWDGSSTVTVPGHTIGIPQVIITYSDPVTPSPLQGVDGSQIQPLGSGTTSEDFVVAYNGLSDGYIFDSGDNTAYYQYHAGPNPLIINSDDGWPASNIYSFPSTLYVNGQTLASTSFSQSFSGGFNVSETYSGGSYSAALNIFVSSDGLSATAWGNIANTTLYATWDPTQPGVFIADAGFGISLTPPATTAPSYGPPKLEWNGQIFSFACNDTQGSDVYCDPANDACVIIDQNDNVTLAGWYSDTGSYDPGSQAFTFFNGDNVAAVSADGMQILGAGGISVYTSGWDPGPMAVGSSWTWTYTLSRPNGTTQYLYPLAAELSYGWGSYWQGYEWNTMQFSGSPMYLVHNIDATNGWPPGDAQNYPTWPSDIYVNGQDLQFQGLGVGGDVWTWSQEEAYYSGPAGYLSFNFLPSAWNFVDDSTWGASNFWGAGQQVPVPSSAAGFYLTSSVYVSYGTGQRQSGPPMITWNQESLQFVDDSLGTDYYTNPNGDQVSIDSTHQVTLTGSHTATGTYNPSTYQFNFGGDPAMQNMVAQDSTGNLLGTPPGVVILLNYEPDPVNSLLQLSGSALNSSNSTVYIYPRPDGSWGAKYPALPQGSFFMFADGYGNYSPLYRDSVSGSGDLVEDASDGGFPDSNLYFSTLYVNGHYAALDSSTQTNGGSGPNSTGGVSYLVGNAGTINIAWTWNSGLSATVTGSYKTFTSINGSWDGGNMFSSLPSGLIISTQPPPRAIRYGPPSIEWDGVQLTFNRVASSLSASNPQGGDVYTDSLGLSVSATVGSDGSVTLQRANGTQVTGSYNASTYQFTFRGSTGGTVEAVNSQGFALLPPSGGTGGGTQGSGTAGVETPGNFDVNGNTFTLGNWTDSAGSSVNGFSISFTSGTNSQPSTLNFNATRQSLQWLWTHATVDGGTTPVTTMKLDSSNSLQLFDPNPSTATTPPPPTIILNPSATGASQFSGTVLIAPQGDLNMGVYTTGTAPGQ